MKALSIVIIIVLASMTSAEDLAPNCPRYTCGSSSNMDCAHSTFNTTGNYQQVVLENNCKTSEFCINGWKEGAGQFSRFQSRTSNMTMSCAPYEFRYSGMLFETSFPGETCKADTDCNSQNGFVSKCDNGKCTGKKQDEVCAGTHECLVGLYCKMETETQGKCAPQAKLDEACKSNSDCVNSAICSNGKCIRLFSLPAGTKLGNGGDTLMTFIACDTGISTEDGYCAKTSYATSTTSKFVTCKLGDTCTYNLDGNDELKKKTMTQECGCGYNSEGKGYCPLSYTADPKAWTDYVDRIRKDFDNGCHSLNVGTCAIKKGYYMNGMTPSPLTAHFFEGAVDCIKKVVLNASSYLSVSALLVMIFALLL